jgi:hypothetical protein
MPDETGPAVFVARARDLLKRLIRGSEHTSREIDRRIGKNRGFTLHLCRRREGLPLAELLAILGVLGVRYEDFFAEVLFGTDPGVPASVRWEGRRFVPRLAAGPQDPAIHPAVSPVLAESTEGPDDPERHLAARFERIKALIDRRILDLFERSLGESAPPPPESIDLDRALAERGEAP